MIPVKLTLHNFLSFAEPQPLDFSAFDLAVLLGDNGAGKSSILEALTWAVWEKTRAPSSDDLIRQGAKEMWVDFVFEHEGQTYRIFRRRDRKKQGTSTLEFQILEKNKSNLLESSSWKTISEATLRSTQEKIIQTLKLPYEIFVNTSYLRQGRADEFTIKTPAERKEILAEILGLEDWQRLEEKAKNQLRTLVNESELINFQLEDLKNQISQKKDFRAEFEKVEKERMVQRKNLEVLEKDFKKLEVQKKQKDLAEEKIINLRSHLEEIIDEIKDLEGDVKENTQEILSLSIILKNKNEIIKKYDRLRDLEKELEILENKKDMFLALKEKLIYFAHQENELKNKIFKLRQISTCPTCLRSLTRNEAEGIIKSQKSEYAKTHLPQKEKFEKEIKELHYDVLKHQKIKAEFQNLKDFTDQKRNLDIAESTIEKLNKLNQKIGENLNNKLVQRQKIISEGKKLKETIKKLEKILPPWEKVSAEIQTCRQELIILEGKHGAITQALKEIERQEESLKSKENKLKALEKDSSVLKELVEAFGKKGIQAMIIEQAIPAIEENANVILRQVTDEQMSLNFITQRIKKTSEDLIETLDIKITDAQGERDYEMFSGGEAFRINFAIRVALSKFLAARSGIHLRFLAMDEGFGTLDAAGREDLIKTINTIQKDFAKIVIITHITELKDLFPTQILITKTENGSQIQTVG